MTLVEMVARSVGRFDPDIQRAKEERHAAAQRRAAAALQAVGWGEWASVVAFLVAVDVSISLAWILADPMQRREKEFPIQRPTRESLFDQNTLPVLQYCHSGRPNLWLGLSLGWKGLLLILGLFLAYESRRLKLRHVNDSRFVAYAVYNMGVLCLAAGPVVTFLISEELNASFAFVASATLLCVVSTAGLIFVPKAVLVWRIPANQAELEGRAGLRRDSAPLLSKASGGTLTAEEERRLAELKAEHEDILRQIAEQETRIAEAKSFLAQRKGAKIAPASDGAGFGGGGGGGLRVRTEASVEDSGYRSSQASVLPPPPLKPSQSQGQTPHSLPPPQPIHTETDVLL